MKKIDCTHYTSPVIEEHDEHGILKKQSINWDLLDEQMELLKKRNAVDFINCQMTFTWKRLELLVEFNDEGFYIIHEMRFL